MDKIISPICRPASIVVQGSLTLYTTSLRVEDLLTKGFYSIEQLDPKDPNDEKYQRVLAIGRASKFADYIIGGLDNKGGPFLPTSIFMATDKDIPFNKKNNTITIDISKTGPLNIVDGQHRVEGFRIAYEKNRKDRRILDFEIPVNIAINLPMIEQMAHFLIVNTTQKSVDEGVAQRIRARLFQRRGVGYVPHLPKWILNAVDRGEDKKALDYVDFLNNREDSVWYEKINMANDTNSESTINQKSFVRIIKKYILVKGNPILDTVDEDKQHKIFLNYWEAITNIIGKEKPIVLFKNTGVELFCRFYVFFLHKLSNFTNWEVKTMETLLQKTFNNLNGIYTGVGHIDFWIKGGTASSLNSSKISTVYSEMQSALNKVSSINKDIKI